MPSKQEQMVLTHSDLVAIAYRWVLANGSCGCAFREFRSLADNMEFPDVIGFGSGCHSVLIECKVSRADYFADRKKHFRQTPELGMGSNRYYCCPAGLISKEECPEGWGLIWVDDKRRAKAVVNPWGGNTQIRKNAVAKNIKAEHGLMYSALRRLHLRGRIDEIYSSETNQS